MLLLHDFIVWDFCICFYCNISALDPCGNLQSDTCNFCRIFRYAEIDNLLLHSCLTPGLGFKVHLKVYRKVSKKLGNARLKHILSNSVGKNEFPSREFANNEPVPSVNQAHTIFDVQ